MPDDFASSTPPPAGILIRAADPERDAAACAAIYAPSVTDSAISFESDPPDAGEFARRIAGYQASHQFLVAEEAGEVLGYAYACPHRQRAAYRWAVETSVYVDAARSGHGVGRALYAELLDRLRRQGFRVAVAAITLPNPGSIALHESMGFEPIGVFPGIGGKGGAWHDLGWWQLTLSAADGAPAEPLSPDAI